MIIIQNKFSSFFLGKNYSALCLFPFLFLATGIDIREMPGTLNHEKIHARQQIEMLWMFFFIWYFMEYLVRLVLLHSHNLAYRNISHEREAYENAGNPDYLKIRKIFSWTKYLLKPAKTDH